MRSLKNLLLLLMLEVVAVCIGLKTENVAKDKPTYQSSTYQDSQKNLAVSSRAVDGSTNTHYWAKNQGCAHTNFEKHPFWGVNLLRPHTIRGVTVYNRMDDGSGRLSNFRVRVLDKNKNLVGECGVGPDMIGKSSYEMMCKKELIGNYVEVYMIGTQYLIICEVLVDATPATPSENAAKDKPTYQSSTYRDSASNLAISSRAVDGSTNTNWWKEKGCACTNSEKHPFWGVNLLRPHTIRGVTVYNRMDGGVSGRLSNFRVRVLDKNMNLVGECGVGPDMKGKPSYEMVCKRELIGNYVEVYLIGTQYLTICEVLVDATPE